MKKHIWLGAFCASLLMACTSGSNQKQTVSAGVLEYDSLSIPIDYPYLGFYYQTAHYKSGNTLYWAGYNHMLHSIEVFDLTNRRTVQTFELEPEGPNGIARNMISNFAVNDSLFVFNTYHLGIKVLSWKDGKLRNTITPFSAEDAYQLIFRGTLDGTYADGFGMRWKGENVVMPIFAKNGQKMDDALAVSVNLRTSEVERLPLAYPDAIKDDLGRYGSLTCPFFTVSEDRIVYNFPYSSQVYVFVPETGEVQTFAMNSNAIPNRAVQKDANIKSRDIRKNAEYERMTLRFGEVYYDKVSDAYVRMHFSARSEMFSEQKLYLMVYRCKTGEATEYELPEYFSSRFFVVDGCVYVLLENHDDTHLRFATMKL